MNRQIFLFFRLQIRQGDFQIGVFFADAVVKHFIFHVVFRPDGVGV